MSTFKLNNSVDDDLEASPHLFTGRNDLLLWQNKPVSKLYYITGLLEFNFLSYSPVSLRKKFISKNNANKIPLRLNCVYPETPNYFIE